MKQLLILSFVLALVVFGYVLYSGSDEGTASKQTQRARPQVQGQQRAANRRPVAGNNKGGETRMTPDGPVSVNIDSNVKAQEFAEKMLEGMDSSWADLVSQETLVRMEDAWDIDLAGIDWEADVLVELELPDGERLSITRDEWRKYIAITTGKQIIQGELFEQVSRGLAARYDEPYGLPDEQWQTFLQIWGKNRGAQMDRIPETLAVHYRLPAEAAEKVMQQQVYGFLAHFPATKLEADLPPMLTERLNGEDIQYVMLLCSKRAEAMADLENEASIALLENLMMPMRGFMETVVAEIQFRHNWTYLDGNMPDSAVAACHVGEIQDELLPPWLQPVGEPHYVELEDVWSRIGQLNEQARRQMLRQTIWHKVLGHELAREGAALTPEENWLEHADDYISRKRTLIKLQWFVLGLEEFPTVNHYRAMNGVRRGFLRTLPEGWDSAENLAPYYENHRLFIEKWAPGLEFILFTPGAFDRELTVDWDRARAEAEEARAQILAGEVEFSTLRARRITELRDQIQAAMGTEEAAAFMTQLQGGELDGPLASTQRALKELRFTRMLSGVSVVRNAVTRLERKEISPVWKTDLGYVLVRVNGVNLLDLAGEYEDYELATRQDYESNEFSRWLTRVLGPVKRVN